MTPEQDEYQKKLKLFQEHLVAAERSAVMLKKYHQQLMVHYPFQAKNIESLDPDIEMLVFAFFKKYEQLVVLLNDNIFKNIPYFELENMGRMSRYDIVVYLEKIGVITSAKSFVDAIAIRNQLTHEYPLDSAKQCALLNHVIVEAEVLQQAMVELQRYLPKRLPIWLGIRQNPSQKSMGIPKGDTPLAGVKGVEPP